MKLKIAVLIIAWYLSGVLSFIFWWTNEHDLTYKAAPTALSAGLIGPFAFPTGWLIHGDWQFDDSVILKKRK